MIDDSRQFEDDRAQKSRARLVGEFSEGQVLGGKYKIIGVLGRGGMGAVYRVRQLFLNKDFALKTINRLGANDVLLQRLQIEAKAASSISHPNLVQVHDFGLLEDDEPYLVMDLIDGITFGAYLKKHGPLAVDDVAPLFSQACFGLLAAHDKGIVHRDIKPGNIMMVAGLPFDAEASVKILDFGIAKMTSRESGEMQQLTRTGEIFGSPLYMSPEQCTTGQVDNRSDIYSLGCVLFEMLTGAPPHMGQTALATMRLHESGRVLSLTEASLGEVFPQGLEDVVSKMLMRDPADRYQNIGLVAHDLAATTRTGTQAAHSRPAVVKPNKPNKPNNQPVVVSMPANRLYLLVAATSLMLILFSMAGGFLLKASIDDHVHVGAKNQLQPSDSIVPAAAPAAPTAPTAGKSNEIDTALVAERSKLEEALNNIKSLASTRVEVDGHFVKRFVFPEQAIGTIYRFSGLFFDHNGNLARKTVDRLDTEPLTLRIDNTGSQAVMLEHPKKFFAKLGPDDFRALMLDNKAGKDGLGAEAKTNSLPDLLECASHWNNLSTLSVNNFPEVENALPALFASKSLRTLQLVSCTVDKPEKLNQPYLAHLEVLSLCRMKPDVLIPIFKGLARSQNLQRLVINNIPAPKSFRLLNECPHFTSVTFISEHDFDKTLIQALCKNTTLSDFQFIGGKVTLEELKLLGARRDTNRIRLEPRKYKPEEEAEFKKEVPVIRFEV